MAANALATDPQARLRRLRITEVFFTLQGEAAAAGLPTTFIRLTGCPLRCSYCDTQYAFSGGQWWSLDALVAQTAAYGARDVCVTGGEPLAQQGCAELVTRLCDLGYRVVVETSGALDISPIDARASRILDLKTPGSGEVERNMLSNLELLTAHDQIKFVLCDRSDFDWACQQVRERKLIERCAVWFSPSYGQLEARELADWIMQSGLAVRLQIQLHKLLWGEQPGR